MLQCMLWMSLLSADGLAEAPHGFTDVSKCWEEQMTSPCVEVSALSAADSQVSLLQGRLPSRQLSWLSSRFILSSALQCCRPSKLLTLFMLRSRSLHALSLC